jgi:hypothetical protein
MIVHAISKIFLGNHTAKDIYGSLCPLSSSQWFLLLPQGQRRKKKRKKAAALAAPAAAFANASIATPTPSTAPATKKGKMTGKKNAAEPIKLRATPRQPMAQVIALWQSPTGRSGLSAMLQPSIMTACHRLIILHTVQEYFWRA